MENNDDPGMGIISYLIIALVVLILLFGLFYKVMDIWKDTYDAQTCRKSVEIHAASHVKGAVFENTLKCPPRYDPIKAGDPDIIKREIADSMAECMWKFGANKLELFGGDLIGENRYCALCHYVKFEGDARGQQIDDFGQFLVEEKSKNQKYDAPNYVDYIVGRPTDPEEIKAINISNSIPIDTNHDYGIMFVYLKDSHLHKLWAGTIGAGIGVAGGLMVLPTGITQVVGLSGIALISISSGIIYGSVGYAAGSDVTADWQEVILLVPWDADAINGLNCTEMPVGQGNK